MKNRLKAAILAGIVAISPVLAANPAEAAGFFTVGSMYEHYGAGGGGRGLFVNDYCDALGFTFAPPTMYYGVANWGRIVSSIRLTGNGLCTGLKVYARDNPAVTWVCPGATCAGKVVNLYPPFNDNVGKIRVFRV